VSILLRDDSPSHLSRTPPAAPCQQHAQELVFNPFVPGSASGHSALIVHTDHKPASSSAARVAVVLCRRAGEERGQVDIW